MVDSNIVLSAILGRSTWRVLGDVGASRRLLASEGTFDEVGALLLRNERFARARAAASDLFTAVTVVPRERYDRVLDRAATALRHAVPSRDGNARDAQVLALAWTLDADIWSHDRDFAGTGWPSWSTANLVGACGGADAPTPA